MQNLTEEVIRRRLAEYLAGKSTLRKFHQWFVPATWDVDDNAPMSIRKLVSGVKLLLAEYSSGHHSKKELRDALLPFVQIVQFVPEGRPADCLPFVPQSD